MLKTPSYAWNIKPPNPTDKLFEENKKSFQQPDVTLACKSKCYYWFAYFTLLLISAIIFKMAFQYK